MLGVGGTSGVVRANVSCWKPGVLIVRLFGFLRALFRGSLRGEVGAEKCWKVSSPLELSGLVSTAVPMLRDKFFTFLPELFGESGCGYVGRSVCCETTGWSGVVCLSWFEGCIVPLKCDKGGFEEADSGEDAGEGSVKTGEECVVAGEETVDSVVNELMLPR